MRKGIVKREPTQVERVRHASRERREQQKEGVRQTILRAAGELFLEQGSEGFSMRRVAERIGYSATTIYRYYENKDDLLIAVVHQGFVEFARRLTEAAQSATGSPLTRLEALGRAYIKFGLESPVYYQMMFMQRADLFFAKRREQTGPMVASFDALRQTVRQAMDAGLLKRGDVEVYSHVIWSVVHGVTSLALANPATFTAAEVEKSTALALKLISDGLRPQK
jgi:AcrR family transcriptional regulator